MAVSSFLDWKGIARYLKLTDSEVGAVESYGRDEQDKRHKTLQKRIYGIWPQTDIHTHNFCNAVTLVWGSLRLAPITQTA